MSHTARADWSAQVPAAGIIGVIPSANLPTTITPVVRIDISQVTARGYAPGQLAQWNGNQFVPYSIPTPVSTELVSQLPFIAWGGITLRPLESAEIAITLPGITTSSQVFIPPLSGYDYLAFKVLVVSPASITVQVTNLSGSSVALPDGTYQMWVL